MASIRLSEVQAWVTGRSEVLAPATVELIYRYVVAIFRAAVADRLAQHSPCPGIRLPKIEKPRVEPMLPETVLALIDAMPVRYRALVVLAAGTGLRQGECFGLSVDRVDFLRRTLTVDRQIIAVKGAPQLAPPKTAASYRTRASPQRGGGHSGRPLVGVPGGLEWAGVHERPRRGDPPHPVLGRVAAGGTGGRGTRGARHACAAPLLRVGSSVRGAR